MKKLGLFLLIVLLGTTISIAQNRGGQRNFNPEEAAKRQTEGIKKSCNLTADQEKKVYALNLKTLNKMVEMRKSAGGDRSAMRDKMMSIRDEQNTEMKKLLTKEQWPLYEKYIKEEREKRRQGGGGGRR